MTKSNREFRRDLAKEMLNKWKNKNEQLELLEKSSLSDEIKEQKRKEIKDIFYKDIEEMKKWEKYEEALKATRNEWSMKSKLIDSSFNLMILKKELKKAQSEDKIKKIKEQLEKEQEDVSNLTELYKQAKLELWDDKPGTFIDMEINRAGSLLERRIINICGVDIEYIISTTKKWKWVVDDCKVVDSFKIKDPKIISEFIDKVIFSYPDLINNRKSIHKEREKREKEIKNSFKLEWLAHNFAYLVLMFWNTEKEMVDPKKKGFLYDKLCFLRESARDVDLDDEQIRKQILFNMAWLIYKYLPEKSNKQKK